MTHLHRRDDESHLHRKDDECPLFYHHFEVIIALSGVEMMYCIDTEKLILNLALNLSRG